MFCFWKKKKKDRTLSKMEDDSTSENKDRIDMSKPGSLSEISDAAVGNVTGMNRHSRKVDTLKDLLFRLHISVRRKFIEESKKSILRWQVCPKEIIQASEEIYNALTENRYKDCLEKAKATLEMIEGFEENKLPYKQELLAYTYCWMALTYVETGDFHKVKRLCPKDRSLAKLKSLEMLPADDNQWDISVLYLEIAKCNLQVEYPLYFPKYSRESLNAATNAGDQELQLYANVLFALIEENQYSHSMAVHFIERSLEMAKGLKDSVAAVDIQSVLRELAEYQTDIRVPFDDQESSYSWDQEFSCSIRSRHYAPKRPIASPFSSDDDQPQVPHIDSDSDDETEPKQVHMDSDSNDETEPKQVHMGTAPPEETHLKMVDTGSTNTDEHTIPKVIHTVGMSLPERLGPEGSSEPPSFRPAVSSSEEQSDSSSSGEETYLKLT